MNLVSDEIRYITSCAKCKDLYKNLKNLTTRN